MQPKLNSESAGLTMIEMLVGSGSCFETVLPVHLKVTVDEGGCFWLSARCRIGVHLFHPPCNIF